MVVSVEELSLKTPKLKLLRKVAEAYHTQREQAKLPVQDTSFKVTCWECKSNITAVDEMRGSVVCMNCGVEVDRIRKDMPFGAGSSQFSVSSSSESFALDSILRERSVGATTKVYKEKLVRRASREIHGRLGIGFSEELVDLAVDMFERYSSTVERLNNFSQVVEACIICARKELARRGLQHQSTLPSFPCMKCGMDFCCRKDLRFHVCSVKRQLLFQSSISQSSHASDKTKEKETPVGLDKHDSQRGHTDWKKENEKDSMKTLRESRSSAWSVKTESDSPLPDSRPATPDASHVVATNVKDNSSKENEKCAKDMSVDTRSDSLKRRISALKAVSAPKRKRRNRT